MHPEERKAIARLVDESINQKNLALLDDHPGYWQTRQIFPLLFQAFPDVSSTIEQQVVEGEWVTTRSTLRGTHLGAFTGVAPTGKSIEIMHISLDQVAEGKVVEISEFPTGCEHLSPSGSWLLRLRLRPQQ